MDRSYKNRLLREAEKHPSRMLERRKFWRLEFWAHYLGRCNELFFSNPQVGLSFTKPAPLLASKVAEATPQTNGADLMLLGFSYLGSAYRVVGDYTKADEAFREAQQFRPSASSKALAEHLRRLAYVRLFQHDPECFQIIEEAIAIHKRGNLVHRHELGECLLCRGHAYFAFKQPGKSLEDISASLNHISLKRDDKSWYCAVHNLAVWAVEHGNSEQLRTALCNLKPVLAILATYSGRGFAKLKLRWLIALVDARLGHYGAAEVVYRDVRAGFMKMKLAYEVGMLQVDLASLYLAQGRYAELHTLAPETAKLFRHLGVEARAQETLDLWQRADRVTLELLRHLRADFANHVSPIPVTYR